MDPRRGERNGPPLHSLQFLPIPYSFGKMVKIIDWRTLIDGWPPPPPPRLRNPKVCFQGTFGLHLVWVDFWWLKLPLTTAHRDPPALTLVTLPTWVNGRWRDVFTWESSGAIMESCEYSELPQPNTSPLSETSTKTIITLCRSLASYLWTLGMPIYSNAKILLVHLWCYTCWTSLLLAGCTVSVEVRDLRWVFNKNAYHYCVTPHLILWFNLTVTFLS